MCVALIVGRFYGANFSSSQERVHNRETGDKKTATAKSLRQCISAISIRNAQIVYFLKRQSYTVYEDKIQIHFNVS